MSRFNTLTRLFCVFHTMVLISCSSGTDSKNQTSEVKTAIQEAQYWIDNNNADTAIQVLTPYFESLSLDPSEHSRVQITLASAYVQKAGIQMAEFVQFLKRLKNLSQPKTAEETAKQLRMQKILEKSVRKDDDRKNIQSILKGIQAIYDVIDFFSVLSTLPLPKFENESYLFQALDILSVDSPYWSHGNYLYRGTLKFIQIQVHIQHREYFKSVLSCNKNFDLFVKDELQTFKNDVLNLLYDISKGLVKLSDKKHVENWTKDISDNFNISQFDKNNNDNLDIATLIIAGLWEGSECQ
ncbi:MAG: hypothetical protein KDD34_00175 [Bdellovibrionales bacterium]|nr:hypothetical protein [Bdellovibrionales bacterium]